MRVKRFTQRFVISAEDGNYTDGSGLWLHVRNGGKAKSWSFRFAGKRINPPGGSAHRVSVEQAQAFVRQCRDQLARGEDPFGVQVEAKQAESKGRITFRVCVAEWYAHKSQHDWGREARNLGRTMMRRYLDPVAFADLPLQDITTKHIETILQPIWLSKPVIAKRTAHFLHGMFRWAKAKQHPDGGKWYVGENPAVVTKDSDLRTVLGSQPPTGHREALAVDDVPKLIAYLRTPRYAKSLPLDPDFCTVREAMDAAGLKCVESINRLIRLGKLPGAYQPAGQGYAQSPYLIPIAELKKVIPLRYPLRRFAEVPLHAWILQFIIFTAVRSDMACHLRWDQVDRKRGIIEYRRHKTEHHGRQYNVVITGRVAEILDAMDALKQREKRESEYVFVHWYTPCGVSHRLNQTTNIHTVNTYLRRALRTIGNFENENACTHGFRTTFATWACDLKSYPYELVKAALGHAVGSQQVDSVYFRNVRYLEQRREMMTHWERHCLSLSDKPQQKKVVRLVREKPRTERRSFNA
jgi:integrase